MDDVSFWEGIPQANLSAENREHIRILCKSFITGPWNLAVNWDKIEWGRHWTSFVIRTPGMATQDGNHLTRLVFAAHDHCVRIDVSPRAFRYLEITMHSGRRREGGTMASHPTIETALEKWREYHTGE